MSEAQRKRARALQMQAAARSRDMKLRAPDGRTAAPGTTEAEAQNIPPGLVYDPRTGGYVDTGLAAERMGKAQGANASFLAGAPFVGEFMDEAIGSADAAMTGRSPEIGTETMRQSRAQFQESNPKTAMAAEISGGVLGSLPLAVKGASVAMNASTRAGRIVRGTALGAGAGLTEGAAAGAGRATRGERALGAAQGGVIGGGIGGLLGALAPLVGEGVEALAKRFKKLDVRAISEEFGISAPAARTVKSALENDDLDAAVARLQQLGDDAMLADSGPATGQLLNAASATGGNALRTTRDAVSARSDQIGARLPGRLDSLLGRPKGVRSVARDISQGTARARKEAYDRAFSQPIDYSAGGRSIETVLERVPPRTLQRAVSEANESMTEAGLRNQQIMAEIADDGSVVFREMPNVQQLDEIKRALDSIGREAIDQFGRPTAQGARARRLARDLRDSIGEAVPEYRTALRVGGDKIQQDEALDLGRRLLFRNTTVEDVRDFTRGGMSQEARDAARQGLRESIEGTLSNVRRTITDPDVDAREAMQLVKDISSRANKDKLRMILGSEKAGSLLDELDRTATALTLRAAVSRNSDTAIRQSIQGQVTDEATPGIARRTLGRGGNPLEAMQTITEGIAGIDPRSMSGREKAIFDEIASVLTRTRGNDAQRALSAVQRALDGQPLKDAEAELIGRLVAGGAVGSGYQAGMQTLEQR